MDICVFYYTRILYINCDHVFLFIIVIKGGAIFPDNCKCKLILHIWLNRRLDLSFITLLGLLCNSKSQQLYFQYLPNYTTVLNKKKKQKYSIFYFFNKAVFILVPQYYVLFYRQMSTMAVKIFFFSRFLCLFHQLQYLKT